MESTLFTLGRKQPGGRARTGRIHLPHGVIATPTFMPVGTNATVKAVSSADLAEIGFQIILANTYHLLLRPGPEVIRQAGGLHGFTGWRGNFLTDSGGFQVFSLSSLRKLREDGVEFRSHIDGSHRFLSPEIAVDAQVAFNSDIQMQLDVCSPWGAERKEAEKALELTSSWAKRAEARWKHATIAEGYQGKLFGIVQGGFFSDLRERSAEDLVSLDLPGYALGGLSVGEPFEVFAEMLGRSAPLLPEAKPRYLMGIGTPEFILEAIGQGIDIFDCVFPTRTARNGQWFTSRGPLAIKKIRYEADFRPADPECQCKICRNYSRSYLRHLFKCDEILHSMLASYHNLYFLNELVRRAALAIEEGRYASYSASFLREYNSGIDASVENQDEARENGGGVES